MTVSSRSLLMALGLVCGLPAGAAPIIALTPSALLRFDSATPGSATTVALTGLLPGDAIVGLDRRPPTASSTC